MFFLERLQPSPAKNSSKLLKKNRPKGGFCLWYTDSMFSKHLLKMILGLVITGIIGIVSLFLINEYDKSEGSKASTGALSNYSADSELPAR